MDPSKHGQHDKAHGVPIASRFIYDQGMDLADIINISLRDDPNVGHRLPFRNVSDMYMGCRDGLVLAKLIQHWVPGILDLTSLHRKGASIEELDVSSMVENNTVVHHAINNVFSHCKAQYGAEDIVNGGENMIEPLVITIVSEGSLRKISKTLGQLSHCCMHQALGQELTFKQLLTFTQKEILERWCNYHLMKAGHQKR
jgi:hypothetical protein